MSTAKAKRRAGSARSGGKRPRAVTGELRRVNAVRVSAGEMLAFVRACQRLPPGGRGFEGHAITAVRLHPNDVEKVMALLFRLRALAHLVMSKKGAPGWTLPPGADGSVMTEEAVIKAAAIESLTERGGLLVFRRERLLRRALQLVDVEAEVQ